MAMEVQTLVQTFTPFPAEAIGLVWQWMLEDPHANFDDYGPKNLDEFVSEMARRAQKEASWLALADGEPVGFIGYLPITERLGSLHGICFTENACGKGIARKAVADVINQLFRAGVEKISAGFFSDNHRVHRFLRSLGAVDEGLLRAHTIRDDIPTDMQMVAIFRSDKCPLVV